MANFTITWQDSFNTNVEIIDTQHKELFNLLALFGSACLMGEDKEIVSDFLFELEDYALNHFRDEEEYMIKLKGHVSKIHYEQHREFEKTLHDLKFDYVSENKPISKELLEYLRNWLQYHVIDLDQKDLAH